MKKSSRLLPAVRPNTALIGIAGVHFVVAELSRRGMIALPTIRNTAGYDVIVVSTDGRRHANIRHDYYVLLRWDEVRTTYDCLMLPGKEAYKMVREGESAQNRRIKAGSRNVLVPNIWIVGPRADAAARWLRRWLKFKL